MNLARFKGDFIKSIMVLVSGTIIAQMIAYLLSPVISRLYTPTEMSYLSLLSRIVAFVSVIATIRLELTLPLPKLDGHARVMYRMAIRVSIWVSLFCLIIALPFQWIGDIDPEYRFIMLVFPFAVFVLAFFNVGTNWAIRTKQFKSISLSKVLSGIGNGATTTLFGFMHLGMKGPILGYLFGNLLSTLPFVKGVKWKIADKIGFSKKREVYLLRHFKEFPMINLPHVLTDLGKELFIAFFLISQFEKEVLGLYDFSFRMLKLPINLIGISIGQVFINKASTTLNEGGKLFPLVKRSLLSLVGLSIVPFGTLMLFGDVIFAFVFGEDWREAGVYCQIIAPWLMVNFIVSPLSQIPLLIKKQKEFFFLSLIGTGLMIFGLLSVFVLPVGMNDFYTVLKIVSFSQFAFLSYVCFWLIQKVKSL